MKVSDDLIDRIIQTVDEARTHNYSEFILRSDLDRLLEPEFEEVRKDAFEDGFEKGFSEGEDSVN